MGSEPRGLSCVHDAGRFPAALPAHASVGPAGPHVLHTHLLASSLTSGRSEPLSRCRLDSRCLCVDGLLKSSAPWKKELLAFPHGLVRVLRVRSIRGYVAADAASGAPLRFLNGVF